MCPGASQYRDVRWLHRHSENEAQKFIGLNDSISAEMSRKEEKIGHFNFKFIL